MPTLERLEFRIHGMDCADEVAILRRELASIVGSPESLAFDILNGKMTVAAGTPGAGPQIMSAVARTGMRAEPWREHRAGEDPGRRARRMRSLVTAASGTLLILGFATHARLAGSIQEALGSEGLGIVRHVPWSVRILYAAASVAGAWFVLPRAWYALRAGRPDMNLLMGIAVAGAMAIGEWFEAATVAFLFAVSLALEAWSIGRARRAVQALLELAPTVVRLVEPQGEREAAPSEVPVGTRFVVRPGEKIPLDGRVLTGASHVNQAPITGESVPVEKGADATVFAGTINGDGALEIESTKAASNTTLARIIRMVGDAQSRRAPSEQWVEGFARIYTPAVLLVAIAVLLLPPLVLQWSWTDSIYASLVLLVIGCPCALVISTPVTIVAALAAAAHQGVLIKGGLHVESPARLNAIAFDKTGTLTRGRPNVVEVVPLDGHSANELLATAAALEAHSDHPLARAILEYASSHGVVAAPIESFRIAQGRGSTGAVNGTAYWLGSHRFLEERNQETPEIHDRLEQMSAAGRSVVVVGNARHVCGLLSVADELRPDAPAVIAALRKAGIQHMVMLTGDNRATADAIARGCGIDEVHAELLPQDKVAAVEALVTRYHAVAMIGDGVNDAPAMARATLGIAMGAAGTDAAIETADIALMSDDLSRVPWLIEHSRRAGRVIKQNIALSLGIKAVFVALTFSGHASLWAAIAADMGVSLVVITNALRLLASDSGPVRLEHSR